MTGVDRVQQPNGYGCGVACVAMVLGTSYAEAEAECAAYVHAKEAPRGIYESIQFELLALRGYAVQQFCRFDPISQRPREPWPLAPFAPVHLALVEVAAGAHSVVVLGDGRVLDPWTAARTSLAHPDYLRIDWIAGLWKVRP